MTPLILALSLAYGVWLIAALGCRGRILRVLITAALTISIAVTIGFRLEATFREGDIQNEWHGLYLLSVIAFTAVPVVPVALTSHWLVGPLVPVGPSVPPSKPMLIVAGLVAAAAAVWWLR